MNNAIKLAIEKGGYKLSDVPNEWPHPYIVQDPKFWQALGKALGWVYRPYWLDVALKYYKLVLTGGDTEKFWKELLN